MARDPCRVHGLDFAAKRHKNPAPSEPSQAHHTYEELWRAAFFRHILISTPMEDQYLSQQALQSELLPGENLIWTGRPSSGVIFHKEDLYLIPFSLMWGGFAIFWELGVTGSFGQFKNSSSFFTLWGIPFVVMGQYLIWGRFLYAAWKKRKIAYGLTPKRVLILDTAWKHSIQAT